LACASCRTAYLPSKRPFAGMYPTVMSSRELKGMHPIAIDVKTLEEHLGEMNVLKPLRDAGMTDDELQIVSRSLSQRGYAELDARRCEKCPVSLVLFAGMTDDAATLRILAFVNGTRILKDWPAASTAKSEKEPSATAE
ncbi:MAG: hypothetical protein MJ106_01520, partial [Lentisphaeria bacterium]|nr:hypothetical protein [Lentisphaeria bacterium]